MTGKLSVSVPALPGDWSVDVDVLASEDLSFRAHLQAGETVELERGTYVVLATMPDGTRRTATRVIEDDQGATLDFDWDPPPFSPLAARAGARSAQGPAPKRLAVRFVVLGENGMDRITEPPLAVVDHFRYEDGVLQVAMDVTLQDKSDGLRFVQLAVDGRIPVSAALPLAPFSEAKSCRLSVAVTSREIDPAVRLGGTSAASVVADYFVGGTPERIAAVGDIARLMLLGKSRHPLAAALGGYALLRLGETEKMRDWPTNLARWYEWLPDGEVIAGELAAKRGDDVNALVRFTEAVRRGPPVFTDGLSVLTARLRSFVARPQLSDQACLGLAQVHQWAAHADLSSLCLTMSGANLADLGGSQTPVNPEAGVDGWEIFHVPFGAAADPEDYWDRGD